MRIDFAIRTEEIIPFPFGGRVQINLDDRGSFGLEDLIGVLGTIGRHIRLQSRDRNGAFIELVLFEVLPSIFVGRGGVAVDLFYITVEGILIRLVIGGVLGIDHFLALFPNDRGISPKAKEVIEFGSAGAHDAEVFGPIDIIQEFLGKRRIERGAKSGTSAVNPFRLVETEVNRRISFRFIGCLFIYFNSNWVTLVLPDTIPFRQICGFVGRVINVVIGAIETRGIRDEVGITGQFVVSIALNGTK